MLAHSDPMLTFGTVRDFLLEFQRSPKLTPSSGTFRSRIYNTGALLRNHPERVLALDPVAIAVSIKPVGSPLP